MTMSNGKFLPGTVIDDKYRIEAVIGVGGMGTVCRAVQLSIDRPVALKLLHPEYAHDSGLIKRFQREARLAAAVGHDNICEVTDLGTDASGTPYLVMPLLKGSSLADVLAAVGGILPLQRLGDILTQTLSALHAAHQSHIVHRDVKPANIFMTTLGDREDFVKLLDFGVSKVLESLPGADLTQTGLAVGTPYYMAPEQALGDRSVDHRIDIYAVGVILYEGLTGRRPYEGAAYNEVISRILTEPYPLPRQVCPTLLPPVESVIIKAMKRDPAERFESATAMQEALENAIFGAPVVSVSAPVKSAATAADSPPNPSASPRVASESSGVSPGPETGTSAVSGAEQRRGQLPLILAIAGILIAVLLTYALWSMTEPSTATPQREKARARASTGPPAASPPVNEKPIRAPRDTASEAASTQAPSPTPEPEPDPKQRKRPDADHRPTATDRTPPARQGEAAPRPSGGAPAGTESKSRLLRVPEYE
jgi:serine/threonine-protein kinase